MGGSFVVRGTLVSVGGTAGMGFRKTEWPRLIKTEPLEAMRRIVDAMAAARGCLEDAAALLDVTPRHVHNLIHALAGRGFRIRQEIAYAVAARPGDLPSSEEGPH